jgi:beta-catenin-like protein 1
LSCTVAAFKSAKLDTNGNAKLKASVEEDNGDAEGGPQTDTIEFDDDDEDGRFFGGGVTKQESEILDYIDKQDQEGEIKVCIHIKNRTVRKKR